MKKGFTLIELLAVIVILVIIALIATPMILGVIKTSNTKGGEITPKPDGLTNSGVTEEETNETNTHKGIVYLDPTNLSNVCNVENSVSTTETKTGCMKWYIFNDDGDNYTMILDHNTTAGIKWNDDNENVAYESSNLYAVVQDLKTTSGWVVEPRLITAEEVNIITGKTGWTSTSTYYYFDSKDQTQTVKSKGSSKYAWLYDNLYDCESAGCNINDNNTYTKNVQTWGYWTTTTYGNASSGSLVWYVSSRGLLNDFDAHFTNYGIRPVITISKSIIG